MPAMPGGDRQPKTCPNCNAVNEPEASFCVHCEALLMDSEEPQAEVHDGMAAANGGLYLTTVDGKVLCLRGR